MDSETTGRAAEESYTGSKIVVVVVAVLFLLFMIWSWHIRQEDAAQEKRDREAMAAYEQGERDRASLCYATGGYLVAGWDREGIPRKICVRDPEVGK